MASKRRSHPTTKLELHQRNKHRERYDLKLLTQTLPALLPFVKPNKYGDLSIDFFDPSAVKTLNTALLKQYYGIEHWDIPNGYLCPPIPGRADLIHHVADLLVHNKKVASGPNIRCLDIGIGANCIYPILGSHEYAWSFLGSDIDTRAISSAQKIVDENPKLKDKVELRLQTNSDHIFKGIIREKELFDLVICNPPFHASAEEVKAGTRRKLHNLKRKVGKQPKRNFGGQQRELWCDGGERKFISNMIKESANYANSCFWFTSLISKETNVEFLQHTVNTLHPEEVRVLPMGQGNKISRILAWTFLSKKQQEIWKKVRWSLSG